MISVVLRPGRDVSLAMPGWTATGSASLRDVTGATCPVAVTAGRAAFPDSCVRSLEKRFPMVVSLGAAKADVYVGGV